MPQPEHDNLYTKTKGRAIGFGEELVQVVLRNLREGQLSDADIWELIQFYQGVVNTADGAIGQKTKPPAPGTPTATEPGVARFVVSSLFLSECHSFLTSQPQGWERLHIVTGNKLSPQERTLDHMLKVALAKQSAIGAVANSLSLRDALLHLDTYGLSLHGLFHSHPGAGASHTRPSSIDLETHERYERRYPLVGCIFVKDGFLRFFRYSSDPFTITICGTGVVPVAEDEHVFKIQNPTARFVSYDTPEAEE